jgi:hypothetical protein
LTGVAAILVLALAVPIAGLAETTSRLTLIIFAAVNASLIAIKRAEQETPRDIFVCPTWVPFAGLAASVLLLIADLVF